MQLTDFLLNTELQDQIRNGDLLLNWEKSKDIKNKSELLDPQVSYEDRKARGEIMSSKLRFELMYAQKGKCKVCGIPEWKFRKRFHAHRILAGKNGGLYTADNVILVCHKCHKKVEGKNE